jgi:hypothetical protein
MIDCSPAGSSVEYFSIWICVGKADYPVDVGGWTDYHNLESVAKTLRSSEALDREFWCGLADKLDPSDPKKSRYKLIRSAGRPHIMDLFHGPLVAAMDQGDLKTIADHLRESLWPDQRVVDWLVDRLDPSTVNSPHLIVKLPPGRPRAKKSFFEELRERIIAAQIDSELREHGKLEAALQSVMTKTGISRTTARRTWKKHS